jgi:hypothetical protein
MHRHRRLVAVLLLVAACGSSGDAARFCDLNSELEGFYPGESFLPQETRLDAGRPKLLEALNRRAVVFDFDAVASFGEIFDDFVDASPDDIRSAVTELDSAIGPFIDAGSDPTIELFEAAFRDEAAIAAGFDIEYWVEANCPG